MPEPSIPLPEPPAPTPSFGDFVAQAIAGVGGFENPEFNVVPPAAPESPPVIPPSPAAAPSAPATPPALAEEPPPKTAADWKKWREARAQEREQTAKIKVDYEKLQKEHEAIRAKPVVEVPKDYDEVKTRLTDYEQRLQAFALEKHPQFEAHFRGRMDNEIALAKSVVGAEHADKVERWLSRGDTERVEQLIEELSVAKGTRLAAVLGNVERIQGEKSAALSKASENWQKFQAGQTAQATKIKTEASQAMEATLAELTGEKGIELMRKRDGDEPWNKGVDERLAMTRHIVSGQMDPKQMTRAAAWASLAPGLMQQVASMETTHKAEIAGLQAEITRLKGTEPNPGGERRGEPPIPPVGPDTRSLAEAVTDAFRRDIYRPGQ